MIGNEAVARGLYEGGLRVASSYPGTPSTEITEKLFISIRFLLQVAMFDE